ncbi:glycerol kinase GlpK [Ureibacillus acetophenoni]|uniref:Glycerol kinase n=1 Tax=Ureibacillus acetophenoni TaxID=614649 RepID=A0A285U9H3_9BACL|nr:glycerol kinase GlpK [Ureibacillus acetophenoni]SOC38565.1 glycerol kinase [Ureibacillus acetophenoni]
MGKGFVMALDAGTTGVRTIIFNKNSEIVGVSSKEFKQIYPNPGWIEHNPMEILKCQLETIQDAINNSGVSINEIVSIGITNQRETTVIWDKHTGKPVYNAIVWSSRQTASYIEKWTEMGLNDVIRQKTGLINDPYFSASKIAWILDNVPNARDQANKGDLLFGTIDTWLIWNLTKGKSHTTDYSNAARTMIFNILTLEWDVELCNEFTVPMSLLPEVKPSNGDFGVTDSSILGASIPIRGNAGDQQAALFGQACFKPGMAKKTFGTAGVFVMNTGQTPYYLDGLTTTIAWGLDNKITYALEGVVFSCGSTIQWLRDGAKMIHGSSDSEWYADQIEDTGGVYLVPAFSGLSAPDWDMYARGIIVGITGGTTYQHIIRAGVEAMAFQTKDILNCVLENKEIAITELRIDGGAVKNNLLCQFQTDILGIPVVRPTVTEMTALGAAYLAGLGVGYWSDTNEIEKNWSIEKVFHPLMSKEKQRKHYQGWKAAVNLTRGWTKKLEIEEEETEVNIVG